MQVSSTRLYAAAIAIVSGIYALTSAYTAMPEGPMLGRAVADLKPSGWIMLGLGAIVLVHGVVLLTPLADAIGSASGPLMIVWAAIMLVDQWLIGMEADTSMMPMMERDSGMIAIAVLMLISGLIMTARPMSADRSNRQM